MSTAIAEQDQFENVSGGFVGVVKIRNGKPEGESVRPGDMVFLTVEEQKATANAHRKSEHNPFINGSLTAVSVGNVVGNHRPIGRDVAEGVAESAPAPEDAERDAEMARLKAEIARLETQGAASEKRAEEEAAKRADVEAQRTEEVGAAVPTGDAPEGQRAETEEVGTPEAASITAPTGKANVSAGPGALGTDARPADGPATVKMTAAGLRLAKEGGAEA